MPNSQQYSVAFPAIYPLLEALTSRAGTPWITSVSSPSWPAHTTAWPHTLPWHLLRTPIRHHYFGLAMIVHFPDWGFSSISIASSSKQAIIPISITHTASELEVQLQQERLVSHKQPFSSWADGVARHTSTTSQKAPALWEPTATAGSTSASSTSTGIDSRLHCRWQHQWNTCPQQDGNTGSSSQVHTHFVFHFSIYYNAGWLYFGFFLSHQKGFFSWNLNGHWVPNVSISLVGPQSIAIHFVVTILILSAYTHCGLLGWVYLGRHPWGYPKRPILGASV